MWCAPEIGSIVLSPFVAPMAAAKAARTREEGGISRAVSVYCSIEDSPASCVVDYSASFFTVPYLGSFLYEVH